MIKDIEDKDRQSEYEMRTESHLYWFILVGHLPLSFSITFGFKKVKRVNCKQA